MWAKFEVSLLKSLSPGNYRLRRKLSVTEPVKIPPPCLPEDEILFGEVDKMEWDLLSTVLMSKIRELNQSQVQVLVHIGGSIGQLKEQSYTLIILKNPFTKDAKLSKLAEDLGALLEMGFGKICLPSVTEPGGPTPNPLLSHCAFLQ